MQPGALNLVRSGLAAVAVFATAGAAFGQGAPETTVRRLGVPAAADVTRTVSSDAESTIWSAARRQDWSGAARQVDALLNIDPDWTPPLTLTSLIRRGGREQAINAAMAAKDWTRVLQLATPGAGRCGSDTDLWARAEALDALERRDELAAFHLAALAACEHEPARIAIIERAARQLDESGLVALARAAAPLASSPALGAARETLREAIDARRFERFSASGAWQEATAIAHARNDRRMLIQTGWRALETDPSLSRLAFDHATRLQQSEEASYGLAVAAFALGDDAPALAFPPAPGGSAPDSYARKGADLALAAWLRAAETARSEGRWTDALAAAEAARPYAGDRDDRAIRLAGDALLGAANRSYEAGDYSAARSLATRATTYAPSRRAGDMRVAWSTLQLGDVAKAETAFRDLYAARPDTESAEGLVLAAARGDRLESLGPYAAITGGPLVEQLSQHLSDAARARADFVTAWIQAPERHPDLQGVAAPWARQSFASRATSGERGENRAKGVITRTSAGFASGRLSFEAGVAAISLDGGTAPASAPVGTPGQSNDSTELDGVTPFLILRTEGATRLSAQLSTTPIGAEVDATPLGEVAIEIRNTQHVTRAALFARSVDDSITSLGGRMDAETGEAWGRVVETGLEANTRWALNNKFAISAGASVAHLAGSHVGDNSRARLQIGVSKDVATSSFDYFATGPFYQFDAYDRNANFHTLGHGGYFSPQTHHRAGWSVNLQTRNAADWVVRFDGALAYEDVRTDSAPVLPRLNPAGPRFASDDTSGLAVSADVEGARRIHRDWIISAGASVIASDAHDDVRMGVSLRYTPGGRAAVLGSDLTPGLFNRDIW